MTAAEQQLAQANAMLRQQASNAVIEFSNAVGFLLNLAANGDPQAKQILDLMLANLERARTLKAGILVPDA